MNRDHLFDNVARALASPMPRRQALKQIVRGIAGATLASAFWPEVVRADPVPKNGKCPGNHFNCNNVVCCNKNTQTCCGTGAASACCRPNERCVAGRCEKKASPS